jgi:RNA polymerase sigma factor (sigma-70 family)
MNGHAVRIQPRSATPYEEHRDYVLAVLARRCAWLDPSDREAILHDAYAVFLEKQASGQLDVGPMLAPQVRAYLTQTALNKAMDEGKRAGRRLSVSLDDSPGLDPPDPGRALDEQLASSFDDGRVREIVAELPERQQTIVKLRFFFDRSPAEVQRYLDVTERVYRRELERAMRHIAERFELVRRGTFCESRRSLILAYVTGVAGPRRVTEARRHLASCPACTHWVMQLRTAVDRVAAVVPPPLLTRSILKTLGHSGAITAAARSRLAALAVRVRGHAAGVGLRSDPSKVAALSGARPGAAAMLVASCLAAGGTATYCVVAGVPEPIRSFLGISATRPRHAGTTSRRTLGDARTADRASAPLDSVRSAPGFRPQSTRATQPSTTGGSGGAGSTASTQAAQVHRATSAEFGVGQGSPAPSPTPSGSSQVSSTGSGRSTPRASSPLPEFDP